MQGLACSMLAFSSSFLFLPASLWSTLAAAAGRRAPLGRLRAVGGSAGDRRDISGVVANLWAGSLLVHACLSLRDAREAADLQRVLAWRRDEERRSSYTVRDTADRIIACQRASLGFIIGRLRLSPPLWKALVPSKGQSVVGLLLGQGGPRIHDGMTWKTEMRSLKYIFSMILKSLVS